MISAIILTYNSAASIARTIEAARLVSDDIHVVDSFSGDDTVAICEALGCHVVQRAFANYADQRNWAIDNLQLAYDWQLHLDADEELEADLAAAIKNIDFSRCPHDGFIVGRKIVFMGRTLRFGVLNKTWHLRLFANGKARCEDRLYDQHFVSPSGAIGRIDAYLLDHQEQSLSEWTLRHNKWSDLESNEILRGSKYQKGVVAPALFGTVIERKRYAKSKYYMMPLFFRSFGYFLYRYILRGGFLDGHEGLVFHVLQGFWFRFLVDAKIYEDRVRQNRECGVPPGRAQTVRCDDARCNAEIVPVARRPEPEGRH